MLERIAEALGKFIGLLFIVLMAGVALWLFGLAVLGMRWVMQSFMETVG